MLNDTILEVFIPPQLDPTSAELVTAVTETAESTSTVVVSTNFITNLLLKASLNMLWSMVNCLQIITHVPLMNLKIPANMSSFLEFFMQIATFDFIPSEFLVWFFELP